MRIFFPFLIVVFLSITGVYPLNDWNEPCTFGECHYDLDSSQDDSSGKLKTASGTLKIWGSHKVISDITPAAGWHIFECEENGLEQLVRMVCVSESAPCSHLFSHSGPEGKIVRLPKGCGKNPFARVASLQISRDPMPPMLASQLRKRDGQVPEVYNLVLDVKFSDANAQHGPIRFAIQAATIPNTNTYLDTHLPLHKRSGRKVQRSHKDIVARALTTVKRNIAEHLKDEFDKIKEDAKVDIGKVFQKTKNETQKVIHDVDKVVQKAKNETQKVVHDVKNDVHKAEVEIPKLFHDVVNASEHPEATFQELKQDAKKLFNLTKTVHFSPNFSNRSITLFKEEFNCGKMHPGVEIDLVTGNATANGKIGVVFVGTIVPAHLYDHSIVASLSADVTAMLQINAELTIMYDSGQIKIMEFPLAGIEFPGILSLGPNIAVAVQLVLLYDFAAGTRLEFGFQVENLLLELPKKEPVPHPDIKFKNGSFSLSSTPFVRNVLQAAFHLIPLVELEFKIFDKFGTTLDLQVDNVIVLKLPIEADAKTQVIKPREFSEEGTVAFDARGLLQDMPLFVRSATELALRSLHGSGSTNIVNSSGWGYMFFSLFRRNAPAPPAPAPLAPGPGPWPGGVGELVNTNTTKKPAVTGCFEVYYILDISVGFTEALKILRLNLDQNSRFWLFRKVVTLIMDCVGTSQPNGHYYLNTIMANLKDLGHHIFGRSLFKDPQFLHHNCTSHTGGMAFATQMGGGGNVGGTNYGVWSLSHTGRL